MYRTQQLGTIEVKDLETVLCTSERGKHLGGDGSGRESQFGEMLGSSCEMLDGFVANVSELVALDDNHLR
jgi:hypothetical protein